MKIRVSVLSGLLVLVAVVTLACGGGGAAPTPTRAPATAPQATAPSAGKVDFTVTQSENPYRFGPAEYTLEKGKSYTFEVKGGKEFHTFNVDELGVSVTNNPGESHVVTITPAKTGTFKLYCIPHETLGMVGKVTVK